MRSIEDIATTGAAWVTEAELAMLCAFAKRAEASEAELERLRNGWAEVESLIGSLRYIGGIVERGEGRTLAPDESVQGAILGYVKTLESEVERLRARLELYDDGLTPEAVRALIVRRGL
jgi:hypothetical protein